MFKGLDKRVKVVLVTEGVYNFSMQLTAQYNVLFAQALGASGTDIGLMNSTSAASIAAASAPIGLAVEKCSIKKIMLLGLIFDIIAMTIFISAWDWRLLIPAFILYSQMVRQMPLADIIFITFTKPQERATIMSLSRLFWGGINLFAPLIAAIIVTHYGGINAQGIRPLYYISLTILIIVSYIVFKSLKEISLSGNREKRGASLIQEYREFFKGERYLKRWILIRLLRDGFSSLLMLFVPLWIVDVKGATPTILGILATVSIITAMSLQIPVGRLTDKLGRKKAFFLLTIFYCLGVFVLIIAPSPEYLILTGVLGGMGGMTGGGIGGTALTPLFTMWWEAVPTESRGRLYGLEGMIFAFSRIPMSILGGILWDQGFKMLVLLIPALAEFLIVIPMLYTIPETLKSK